VIKKDVMGVYLALNGRDEKCTHDYFNRKNLKERDYLGDLRRRWEDNIKIDI
jgi:hypothetical protein